MDSMNSTTATGDLRAARLPAARPGKCRRNALAATFFSPARGRAGGGGGPGTGGGAADRQEEEEILDSRLARRPEGFFLSAPLLGVQGDTARPRAETLPPPPQTSVHMYIPLGSTCGRACSRTAHVHLYVRCGCTCRSTTPACTDCSLQ